MKIMDTKCWITISLIFIAFAYFSSASTRKTKPKIAVIGAGVGGASTAHFLTILFEEHGVEIDVYEKSHVGGRLSLSELDGNYYEMGGLALHSKQKYMQQFVKDLGLSKRHVFGYRQGLYDGKRYLVLERFRSIASFGRQVYRYGNSMTNWFTILIDMLSRFARVYDLQDKGHAYTSVEKLLDAVDPMFINLTQITAKEYFTARELLPVYVNEMVESILKSSYGQSVDVSAFVGTISLLGARAGLWSVKGGNDQIPKLLIKISKARLILRKVNRIALLSDGSFEVHSQPQPPKSAIHNVDAAHESSTATQRNTYDMVIVTTPLIKELSDISFDGFPTNMVHNAEEKYSHMVTTLVNGVVNTTYLAVDNSESALVEILATNEKSLFNSLIRVQPVDSDEDIIQVSNVWKVSSRRPLTEDEMDLVFVERQGMTATHWMAYPHYRPSKSLGPFVLHPGLFYTSSIDWAACAMEMSAISGRNTALLAFYHWTDNQKMVDFNVPKQHDEL